MTRRDGKTERPILIVGTVFSLCPAPAAVSQVGSSSRGQARKPLIAFDFSNKTSGLTLAAVRIPARHQEVAWCKAGGTPYASCTCAVALVVLLIRRSLVRAQVGEPKKDGGQLRKRLALRRFWVRRCSGSFSSSGTTSFNGSHDASKSSPAGPAALGASARRHGLEGAGSALQSAQDLVRHIV